MNSKSDLLALKRERLVQRATLQRRQLGYYYQRLDGPVQLLGSAFGFARTLRRSPLLVTGLAALLTKTRWRRFGRIPRLAWRTWKIARFVRGFAFRSS